MSKKLTMTLADVGSVDTDIQVVNVTGVNCKLPSTSTLKALKKQAVDLFSCTGVDEFASKAGGYQVTIKHAGGSDGEHRACSRI